LKTWPPGLYLNFFMSEVGFKFGSMDSQSNGSVGQWRHQINSVAQRWWWEGGEVAGGGQRTTTTLTEWGVGSGGARGSHSLECQSGGGRGGGGGWEGGRCHTYVGESRDSQPVTGEIMMHLGSAGTPAWPQCQPPSGAQGQRHGHWCPLQCPKRCLRDSSCYELVIAGCQERHHQGTGPPHTARRWTRRGPFAPAGPLWRGSFPRTRAPKGPEFMDTKGGGSTLNASMMRLSCQ
jgi:hypothetical protein